MAGATEHYNFIKPEATDTSEIITDLNTNYDSIDTELYKKADKDSDAVENNLAKFDNSGNPVDSGIATSGVLDAVNKKHSQNTDTGTSQNSFNIGDGTTGSDKYVYLKKAASNNPGFRFNVTTSKLQFSHDGTNWEDVGNGSGGADQQARAMALWGL